MHEHTCMNTPTHMHEHTHTHTHTHMHTHTHTHAHPELIFTHQTNPATSTANPGIHLTPAHRDKPSSTLLYEWLQPKKSFLSSLPFPVHQNWLWKPLQSLSLLEPLCNPLTWACLQAFSLFTKILGACSTIHSGPVLFFFFLKWRLAQAHKFHSLCQDQSTNPNDYRNTLVNICVFIDSFFRVPPGSVPCMFTCSFFFFLKIVKIVFFLLFSHLSPSFWR